MIRHAYLQGGGCVSRHPLLLRAGVFGGCQRRGKEDFNPRLLPCAKTRAAADQVRLLGNRLAFWVLATSNSADRKLRGTGFFGRSGRAKTFGSLVCPLGKDE